MVIKNFKLKKGVSIKELLDDGFEYSCDCKYLSKVIHLEQDIIAWINISLTDYTLDIAVIDDAVGQYYAPFYTGLDDDKKRFDYLENIIKKYNSEIGKLNSIVQVI